MKFELVMILDIYFDMNLIQSCEVMMIYILPIKAIQSCHLSINRSNDCYAIQFLQKKSLVCIRM